MKFEQWKNFNSGSWEDEINVEILFKKTILLMKVIPLSYLRQPKKQKIFGMKF